MIHICEESQCTGCMVCMNVCPVSAITSAIDTYGFERPLLAEKKCIGCHKCIDVCPQNIKFNVSTYGKRVYAAWSKDAAIRYNSTSGGAFIELARFIIRTGGFVVGAAFDNESKIRHTIVSNEAELSKLQGSKYVQSSIADLYTPTKQLLDSGKRVLFSGTPCQIAGLRQFLGKKYNGQLYAIDLVCHGVPSPRVFKDYINYMESKYKGKVKTVSFRSKKKSWFSFGMEIHFSNGKTYFNSTYKDPFIRGFLRELFLRPSCHTCHYTSTNRMGDITLADFWGYHATGKDDFDNDKGISMVMINSENGEQLFNQISNMNIFARPLEEAVNGNRCLREPFPPGDKCEAFWKDYGVLPFQDIVKKYLYPEKTSYYAMERYVDVKYSWTGKYIKKILTKVLYTLNIKY